MDACTHCGLDKPYKDGLCIECWILDVQIDIALNGYEMAESAATNCGCRACAMAPARKRAELDDLTETWLLVAKEESGE